jgi:tripartite-type tricarboxylate transporter receptor subunit TctC
MTTKPAVPMRRRALLAGAALATAVALPAFAQPAWPNKPIRVYVGYAAGGAVDVVARAVGQKIGSALGQPVLVENKPGAGSNIAIKAVIESAPDGYTLLLAANALTANMALFQPAPFDAERDLAPIAQVGRVPVVIAGPANTPTPTLKALIDAAKAKPGSINYASPGNGSTPHLAVELFARAAGISLAHVPYKGGAPAMTDVIGGIVPLVAVNALEVQPQARAGKLKVIAVMSPGRSPVFPEVPTIAESGYPGFEAAVWYGFLAPIATPKPVLERLHGEIQKALASPEVRERIASVGGEVTPGSSADFALLIKSERARYEKLVREAKIKPD